MESESSANGALVSSFQRVDVQNAGQVRGRRQDTQDAVKGAWEVIEMVSGGLDDDRRRNRNRG